MKKPRVEVISYSGHWQREKDSNIPQNHITSTVITGLLSFLLSILVSIFFFLMGEESSHGILISRHISLGDVSIDPVHRAGIGPSSDLHGDLLRDLLVISQGSK